MAEILVIGGGVAGLSAGIYAQLSGHQATICERQSVAGGNLMGWQRGEYHIDNCIHWLTGTNPKTENYKLWKDLGALGDVDIYQADSLYTYEENGITISLYQHLDKLKEELLKLSPEDEKEINNFITAVKLIQSFKGVSDKKGFFNSIKGIPLLYRYFKMSTGDLAKRFKNLCLQGFITSMLGKDFAALALIIVFATFCSGDGGIPAGSSLAMSKRMINRFLTLGGKLLLDKEATRIIKTEDGLQSVYFTDGTILSADYVVVTTEPIIAFEKLLNAPIPKDLLKQYNNPKMPRFSSIHCAFACDTDNLPFRNDFIFKLPKTEQAILKTENLIIREFTHEKGFAPKGKTVIQSLTFCDEDTSKKFIELRKNTIRYRAKKTEIANLIQNAIIRKFPQLNNKLQCIDVWTPATYHRYINTEIGSYMSFLLPSKTIPKRINNLVKNKPGVVLATQWLRAPGGLPIAAQVGKEAIMRILQKEKRRKKG